MIQALSDGVPLSCTNAGIFGQCQLQKVVVCAVCEVQLESTERILEATVDSAGSEQDSLFGGDDDRRKPLSEQIVMRHHGRSLCLDTFAIADPASSLPSPVLRKFEHAIQKWKTDCNYPRLRCASSFSRQEFRVLVRSFDRRLLFGNRLRTAISQRTSADQRNQRTEVQSADN